MVMMIIVTMLLEKVVVRPRYSMDLTWFYSCCVASVATDDDVNGDDDRSDDDDNDDGED